MTASPPPMRDSRADLADSGETDRQMVLIHVDNTLLAMRMNNRLSHHSGSLHDRDGSEYAAAQGLLNLQRRLFAGAVPVPGHTSVSSPVRGSKQPDSASSSPFTSSPSSLRRLPGDEGGDGASHYEVSEVTILSAFANVCRSPNTSAVVTGVALTALVDMLDLPCAFVSTEGVYTAIEAASETRADVQDSAAHEVLLSRIFSVYVAALNHPAAALAEGVVYVRALGRMMVLATHSEASQLLKRTVEKSMRLIAMTLFRRLLYLPQGPSEQAAVVEAATQVLRFISRLISGETAGFDNDGNEIVSCVAFGSAEAAASAAAGGASAPGSGEDKLAAPSEKAIALIQLEGLALAQDCLLLLRRSLSSPLCAPLLDAVQNQLCRALLIAGLGTQRSVVLAQVLRTVHLVMQSSAEHLIPQVYNFIRVLHLNPLEALTNELADVGAGFPGGSPVSARAGSPAAAGAATSGGAAGGAAGASPASPSGPAPPNPSRLSPQQVQRKMERRDILLDSLAEFCSDPRFGGFCFVHYDLSWRYASLLPQLCQVLANHAYPMSRTSGDDADAGSAAAAAAVWSPQRRRGGLAADRDAAARRRQRAAAAADSRRDRRHRTTSAAGRLLRSTQRTALDAATNMVSGIALRSIAAGVCAANAPAAEADTVSGSEASRAATSPASSELRHLIRRAQHEKDTLSQFALLFEDSPMKKGIPFLLEHAIRVPAGGEEEASLQHRTRLVLAEPAEGRQLGEALYRLSIVLNKRVLGDYIGEQGRDKPDSGDAQENASKPAPLFSVRFFVEQLMGFIHQFEFRNKPLLEAIREMVYLLCLPGESQKIDRVMEAFANHWYQQNLVQRDDGTVVKDESINPFHSQSGAFVLSFAIIMLNTDQHSGKVAQPMKKDDFVRMNRGIDEGKDVPAAYLGSIYDDVRLHEVVMADMMDRGFANDTTWKLEMRPCANFVQHALGTRQAAAEAAAVEALTSISVHAPSGAVAAASVHPTAARPGDVKDAVLHTLDPFLFQSLWKRSLLVFDGMLESSVDEVSMSIVASGGSVAQAVEDAQQQLPAEMAILESSLRGICMLARAAHALALPAVADQCFMRLLQFVVMSDLTNAEEEVRALYSSVPKLMCMREVFTLFTDIHGSLSDSWLPLSRLLLDVQLMGLLAAPPGIEASKGRRRSQAGGGGGDADAAGSVKTAPSTAAVDNPLGVLLEDPGICANVFAPLSAAALAAASEPKASSERGWFSSFFGGRDAPQVSAAQLAELRDARGRLHTCLPAMTQLLSMMRHVMADAPTACQCVRSLCAVSSIDGAAASTATTAEDGVEAGRSNGSARASMHHSASPLDEASAYAASYELALICGVVGVAEAATLQLPEHLGAVTSRITRLLREVDVYLADPRASDGVRAYWCTLGRRVVRASLQLMAAHWQGHGGAVALEQLWACWMRVSAPVFTAVVAQPVAAFLYDHIVRAGGEATTVPAAPLPPLMSGSEVLVLLSPFATHAAAVSEMVVQRQVSAILLRVVQQRRYSIADDTESVVSLCLSFSAWLRHGHATGSSTAVGEAAESSSAAATGATVKAKNGAAPASSRAVPASPSGAFLPTGASVAEILSLCGRNVLLDAALSEADRGARYELWVLVLRSLGALALCSPESRDGSEAILCLQRALLDSEASSLPPPAVVAVYQHTLIPLTERLCVPKARVHAGLRWGGTALTMAASSAAAANGEGEGPEGDSGGRRVLGHLFSTLLSPAPMERNSASDWTSPTAASSASPSSSPPSSTSRRLGAAAPLVATEVKCRLLSLMPKVLLRYTAALTAHPDMLMTLWRQVLGTLYAVYSAYPGAGVAGGRDGAARDEAMLVQEAVEETVKNMIYVVAATWHDPTSSSPPHAGSESADAAQRQQEHTAAFWAAMARLVSPFPFAGPLMDFMAQEGFVRVEAAEAAPDAIPSDLV